MSEDTVTRRAVRTMTREQLEDIACEAEAAEIRSLRERYVWDSLSELTRTDIAERLHIEAARHDELAAVAKCHADETAQGRPPYGRHPRPEESYRCEAQSHADRADGYRALIALAFGRHL